jgi:hypothetical protein
LSPSSSFTVIVASPSLGWTVYAIQAPVGANAAFVMRLQTP